MALYDKEGARVIPKILHQIWFSISDESDSLYAKFEPYRDSWNRNCPSWDHYVWTESMCRKLIELHFPSYLRMYDEYEHPIQRIDFVRYAILYTYGGVYADMDTVCMKDLSVWLQDNNKAGYLVSTSNPVGSLEVSNLLMASVKGNRLWLYAIEEASLRIKQHWYETTHLYIMRSTGPLLLDYVYKTYKYRTDTGLFPSKLFNPFSVTDSVRDMSVAKNCYVAHVGAGSWEGYDTKIMFFVYNHWIVVLLILTMLIPLFVGGYTQTDQFIGRI
jgi:mannosyltransferase OCH1-like enzyme